MIQLGKNTVTFRGKMHRFLEKIILKQRVPMSKIILNVYLNLEINYCD